MEVYWSYDARRNVKVVRSMPPAATGCVLSENGGKSRMRLAQLELLGSGPPLLHDPVFPKERHDPFEELLSFRLLEHRGSNIVY